MKHYTYDEWLDYIYQYITPAEQERYEQHLYDCDECLAVYASCFDGITATKLPTIEDADQFTERVLAAATAAMTDREHGRIEDRIPGPPISSSSPRKTLLYYTIAATLTLVLMSTGAFQEISNQFEDVVTTVDSHQRQPAYSDKLLAKTLSFIEGIHPYERGVEEDK